MKRHVRIACLVSAGLPAGNLISAGLLDSLTTGAAFERSCFELFAVWMVVAFVAIDRRNARRSEAGP